RRRHTRFSRDWSSDVCSSDLRPDFTFGSLDDLIDYVQHQVTLDDWHYPMLLMPSDYGFQEVAEPADPFEAGAVAFARGMPFSAKIGRAPCRASEYGTVAAVAD